MRVAGIKLVREILGSSPQIYNSGISPKYVLACEPTLSQYYKVNRCRSFYIFLSLITAECAGFLCRIDGDNWVTTISACFFFRTKFSLDRGGVYDLGDPEFLPRLISGIAIQAFENECLVTQYIDEVHSLAKNGQLNPDDIANKLLSELQAKGVTQHVLVVDDMHIESSKIVKNNVDIWLKAEATAEARARIQEVPPIPSPVHI